MTTLGWIIAATIAGGVLSVGVAALFMRRVSPARVPMLISFAVGALLGAVFLEILPHAFGQAESIENVAAMLLGGLLLFFILEKLVLWRHCHEERCEAHDPHDAGPAGGHDHGRSGMMIMIGDTVHNFVDGVLIAAAFIADTQVGIVTAAAIIAHEVPQEVGDFLILLHSGYERRTAFLINILSSVAMVLGGLLGYFALNALQEWILPLIALAAASMLYVAVADLIPGLHKRPEPRHSAAQVLLIGLGIGCIWATHLLFEH
ncbi:MAG: ZIP family metal transporter [Acidobacteria bacterium]|nr:ZIP family metal transporter [Acidobacteriota bacterium]